MGNVVTSPDTEEERLPLVKHICYYCRENRLIHNGIQRKDFEKVRRKCKLHQLANRPDSMYRTSPEPVVVNESYS